jgi:hypothetical protein
MKIPSDYFWGILFIVLGISFFAKYFFHWDVPIVRVIIGFVLIYLGVVVLIGGFGPRNQSDIIFGNGNLKASAAQDEYNLVFSKGEIDLSSIAASEKTGKIDVSVVFSAGTVIINQSVPAVIKVNSAFASADLPNGTSIHFGDYTYKTKAYVEGSPYMEIEVNVVFGKMDIVEK